MLFTIAVGYFQVRDGLSLNLQFKGEFQIENHFNYTDCVYDYLKVNSYTRTEYSAWPLRQLSDLGAKITPEV